MSTNMRKTIGRVTHTHTHTHTQGISRNKLDKVFCAQKIDIVDKMQLVIQSKMYS